MTDKKEMSVNESLAKVNMILRSAGDLILPRETNIALSILADVACQQQEVTDAYRERVESVECMLNQLLSDSAKCSTAQELLQAVDELSAIQVSGEDHARAQELYFFVQNKVRMLVAENDVLRSHGECKKSNLSVVSSSITMTGNINNKYDKPVDSAPSSQNNSGRSKYNCLRVEDGAVRALISVSYITAVVEDKHNFNEVAIYLAGGQAMKVGCSYEEVTKSVLESLGKERGTINNPANI